MIPATSAVFKVKYTNAASNSIRGAYCKPLLSKKCGGLYAIVTAMATTATLNEVFLADRLGDRLRFVLHKHCTRVAKHPITRVSPSEQLAIPIKTKANIAE